MKKNILFIALTLLVLKSNAQEYKEYFSNGNIKVSGVKENNVETGEWKYYFENGKISKTGEYEKGKLNGEWKYYYNNSVLSKIGERENGIDVGTWKYFNKDGTLKKIEKKVNEKKAIGAIIDFYFVGTKTDNPDLLRKAFHPKATLKYINTKGKYTMVTIEKFFSYFTNTKKRSFVSKIYFIDITGTTANVKLSTKYKTYKYTDYLNLLKTKDGWKIVSKISHQDFF